MVLLLALAGRLLSLARGRRLTTTAMAAAEGEGVPGRGNTGERPTAVGAAAARWKVVCGGWKKRAPGCLALSVVLCT